MAKVEQLVNKNQFVIFTNNGIYFQSYNSVIAKYHCGKLQVSEKWDYSNTTRKHFYIFLEDYTRLIPYGVHPNKKYVLNMIKDGKIEIVDEKEIEF